MISTPKVSVIIPVYNAEKYLEQCLESVLNQTLQEIEVICVDDGSIDRSLDILEKYQNRDERVHIICQENRHAGVARNVGLAAAKGEYVHFLDADDWVETCAYKDWYAIAKDQDADACVCFFKRYDNQNGKTEKVKNALNKEYISVSSFKENPKYFIYNAVVPWNKIYLRSFLIDNDIRFDDLICANDRAFYFRMLSHATRIVIVQEYWMNYRINNRLSLVGETRLKHFDCHFRSFEYVWELFVDAENETKSMILDIAIKDFFNFYHKAKNTVYEKGIKDALEKYLKSMDFTLMGEMLFQCSWYPEYLRLTKQSIDSRYSKLSQELKTVYQQRDEARREVEKIKKDNRNLQEQIKSIQASKSFRIGRAITFPGRKIRGGIKCYQEHGVKYTIKRCYDKVIKFSSKIKGRDNSLTKWGLSEAKRSPRIIVSLTSYPGRIETVYKTIQTLLSQTMKPDKVVLWLAKEQFPQKERNLPKNLLKLKRNGLSIEWCEDLRSYKKLIPSLRNYPEDIIVTADDDAYYDEKWLELLYLSYTKERNLFIHCHRITKFFCPDGEYHIISASKSVYTQPTYLHKLVGLGGVLYPPHCLHEDVFCVEKFKKFAPTNDDIWFWLMAALNGTKVKVIENNIPIPRTVEGSQDNGALTKINDSGEQLFWKDFYCLMMEYPELDNLLKLEYDLMHQIDIVNRIPFCEKNENYYKTLNPLYYKAEIITWYQHRTKKFLNLDSPRSFNEKIQWLKLYDSTPLKTKLADKYLVRDWVKEKIGEEYLIPLLGVYDSYDQIDFDILPEQFVMKANHGSGWNIIVQSKKLMDRDKSKECFNLWMKRNFAFANGLELHYMNIEPKIIIENYMADFAGDIYDYRFFCFNGEPKYVWVDIGSGTSEHRRNIYDLNWKRQNYLVSYPSIEPEPDMPSTFEKMKSLAQTLCNGFAFVRVDFYSVNESIYFGEMTFTPQSGAGQWEKEDINILYGDLIQLPEPQPFIKQEMRV